MLYWLYINWLIRICFQVTLFLTLLLIFIMVACNSFTLKEINDLLDQLAMIRSVGSLDVEGLATSLCTQKDILRRILQNTTARQQYWLVIYLYNYITYFFWLAYNVIVLLIYVWIGSDYFERHEAWYWRRVCPSSCSKLWIENPLFDQWPFQSV